MMVTHILLVAFNDDVESISHFTFTQFYDFILFI